MLLSEYALQTNQLLQNPAAAANPLYAADDITSFINRARVQLAGDGECIRNMAALNLVEGQRVYPFSAITLGDPAAGIEGIFNVRFIWYQVGTGQAAIRPRPWAWFSQYRLNNPVPSEGPPKVWAQYGQGETGSLYIDPLPDMAYVLPLDTVCVPIDLVDDTTVDAIPDPFTAAVPYFAAFLACLSAQSGARQADAERHLQRYTEFKNRARTYSTPSILPSQYEQTPSQTRGNLLGLQPAGGGAPQ